MAATGEHTRPAMREKELTSSTATRTTGIRPDRVLTAPVAEGAPRRATPGRVAGVWAEQQDRADQLAPQRPGVHGAATTDSPVGTPRGATQAGQTEQSPVVAQAGGVQDRVRTTGGGQVEGGGAYVSPVGTDAKPAHGGQGRDGSGLPPVGKERPDREPDDKSLALARNLQILLREFQKRGNDLTFVQEWMFNGIGSGLMSGQKQGHIESFTGSGKSLPIVLLAAAGIMSGQRVLIAGHSKDNLDQLLGEDNETGAGKFARGLLDFAQQRYGGRGGAKKAPIEFATYAGILQEYRRKEEGHPGKFGDFDLILGDECHRSLGTETVAAMYGYMPNATKIGFSATPDYAADRKSEEIWGNKWFEFSFRAALESPQQNEKQIIAPIRTLIVPTGRSIEILDPQGEFTQEELRPLIEDPERNGLAIKYAREFVADGRQVFIPTVAGNDNAHARVLAYMLSQLTVDGRQIVAKDHGSHLSPAERKQRIKDYRDGKIDILLSTQSLDEAIDIPASACIDLSPTTSPRKKKQRIGRIARPNEDGRESIYVEFVDEQTGGNKQLYSVLHALEIEEIDVTRVLGWGNEDTTPSRPKRRLQDLAEIVDPDLLERLMSVQGKSITEILIKPVESEFDPERAMWERRLAEEGMPAELPVNTVYTPELANAYTRAALKLMARLKREPVDEEIIEAMDVKSEPRHVTRQRLLAMMGIEPEKLAQIAEEDKIAIALGLGVQKGRITPEIIEAYQQTAARLLLEFPPFGPQPTEEEIIEAMDPRKGAKSVVRERLLILIGEEPTPQEITKAQIRKEDKRAVVRDFAHRVGPRQVRHARHQGKLPLEEHPDEQQQRYVEGTIVMRELARVLDYLDPRQQLVIMERFGFNGEPKTLDEVAFIIDRTRESVRQIEVRALNRLAHYARSNRTLNELMSEPPMYDQPQTVYQKRTDGTSLFDTFPEAQIPVIDEKTTSSYLDRLAIASAVETNKWLEGQREELDAFIERRLYQHTYLKEIAKMSEPIYRHDGHIMAHDPDGTAERLYDPNLLRATALSMRQHELKQQMEKLKAAKRRITDRPVHEDSQDARKASLIIIDGRLAAMLELHTDLEIYIKDYRDEAHEFPDFKPIGSHLFT